MALKDLGIKMETMYPSMEKEKKHYSTVEVPISMMEGMNHKPGDACEMKIKGEIESIDKKFVRVKLKEGEMYMPEKKKSLLAEA